MRSKAPLALMEQMIMLLVFALASALCLQAFVKSDNISRNSVERDHAALLCQSTAEMIQNCGGDPAQALSDAAERLELKYDGGLLWMDYDESWNSTSEGTYHLTAQEISSEVPGLNSARVAVESEGKTVFEINIAWQGEVTDGD